MVEELVVVVAAGKTDLGIGAQKRGRQITRRTRRVAPAVTRGRGVAVVVVKAASKVCVKRVARCLDKLRRMHWYGAMQGT